MNYIYDVLLNLKKEYYDFYEWNPSDEVYQMRKVPIIKVSEKQIKEIFNNTIKFDITFLKTIQNRAERFKQNDTARLKYVFIITDGQLCIALKLSKGGFITEYSSILLDESEDIIQIVRFQKEVNLNYKIICNKKINNFKTRFEFENEKIILNEIEKMYKNRNYSKLCYIYLECFGKKENNISKIYQILKKTIGKTDENFHKIYDILKIANQK